MLRSLSSGALFFLLASAACSDAEEPPPPPPTKLVVRVVDGVTGGPVAGAYVDVEGAGGYRTTGTDGTLTLELSAGDHPYRVTAAGYAAVPPALAPRPVASLAANQTTEVEAILDPVPAASTSGDLTGTVTIDGAPTAGVLVVAVGVQTFSGYTDETGGYVVTGLNAGTFVVRAAIAGASGDTVRNVAVANGATTEGVDIALSTDAGVEVSGAITGGSGDGLVALLDGDARRIVPGLTTTGGLSERYAIGAVPPGTYRLLGAYDEDAFVMDPEPVRTAGLPTVTVMASPVTADFAVVPTIDGLAPTGTATTTTPRLSWAPVAGADYYVVDVRNASGRTVWGGFDAAGRWTIRVLDGTSVAYAGPTLVDGASYTFRVFAAVQDPVVSSVFSLIAASEPAGARFRVKTSGG